MRGAHLDPIVEEKENTASGPFSFSIVGQYGVC